MNFAIIGTNWITERFIDSAKRNEEFKLTAVYSRTHEKAKEFADKHGAEFIFTNLEKMATSDVFDAVYIASPNSLHAEQAIIMMKHNKHVLVEKPAASNRAEWEAMALAARENGVLLMEAMRSTIVPNFQRIRDSLEKIGPVRRFVGNACQYSSRYDAYKEGSVLNAFKPEFSNGSLMDIGIYCLYPMVVLFGKPDGVKANAYMLESGVDGEGSIVMRYADKEAVVMYSKISNSYMPSEIQGENGSILIHSMLEMDKVEIRYKDGSREDISVTQDQPSMFYEAKEFMELVRAGERESRINSHAHSKIVMEVMDESRRQIGLVYPADLK
ncbi:Gfo/Idh/MocA family protein [Fictibacillus iocasae]|uniref:Gfo/Idh/MocA family protein n=1 Tax=Fictibacillus iocasae TaxID=2715437 RepID=A0ABW2NKL2_9BACL